MAYILGEVCARPRSAIVDRGWRAVDAVFNDWDDLVKHGKKGMHWMPMRRLMAKARKKREADILSSGDTLFTQPSLYRDSDSSDTLSPNPPTYGSYPGSSPRFFDDGDHPNSLDPILQPILQHSPSRPGTFPSSTITPEIQSQPQPLAQTHPHLHLPPQQPYSSQPSQQQQQSGEQQASQIAGTLNSNRPWILDDSALVDLDMSNLDAEGNADAHADGDLNNVNNWDELVSYFQMETDAHGVGSVAGAGGQLGDPRFNGGNGVGGFNVWY
jgi:hypothetical protein